MVIGWAYITVEQNEVIWQKKIFFSPTYITIKSSRMYHRTNRYKKTFVARNFRCFFYKLLRTRSQTKREAHPSKRNVCESKESDASSINFLCACRVVVALTKIRKEKLKRDDDHEAQILYFTRKNNNKKLRFRSTPTLWWRRLIINRLLVFILFFTFCYYLIFVVRVVLCLSLTFTMDGFCM